MERKGILQFHEQNVTVVGADLTVGMIAPEFSALTPDWETIPVMQHTKSKVRIIASLLSMNTSVCDRETRRFNLEASALGKDISIVVLSMDLPFTIKNWCGATGVDNVLALSDHINGEFGMKYGLLLKEFRFLRRAIFVVDRQDVVRYSAYMKILSDEPNYEEVLSAARAALA